MEIVLLTPEHFKINEAETVNQLFKIGLKRLHLRKPEFSLQEYRNYFQLIEPEFHSRVVLHGGGFELYGEQPTGGIHLNSLQRTDSNILRIIGNVPEKDISTSFHSWSEIAHNDNEYGYVFISPVFDSISKTDYKAAVDFRGLATVKKRCADKNIQCPKIYGLGGIDVPHLHILKQYHFDGAAIFGAIWKSPNPVLVLQHLLQLAGEI